MAIQTDNPMLVGSSLYGDHRCTKRKLPAGGAKNKIQKPN